MAIGAASIPPMPPWNRSSVTATATSGVKHMNHGWLSPVVLSSAVPVLPATSTPSSAAAVPVPSRTTFFIIAVSSLAVLARHHALALLGLDLVDRPAVGIDAPWP